MELNNMHLTCGSFVSFSQPFLLRFPAPSEEHTRPEGGVDEIPSAMRVLVVDDDRMVRRITAAYLLADGHTVQTAANGMEALETLDKEEFDLVVTDRAMPEMSGDQLATTIKRRAPKTCVVMLTGFGVVMDRAPADVDGVVAKPITRDELRRAIARAMGDG